MHGALKHSASPSFWACYQHLPEAVRSLADKNLDLLESDPRHPSLHLNESAASGPPESAFTSGLSAWTGRRGPSGSGPSGSGSAVLLSATCFWDDAVRKPIVGSPWHERRFVPWAALRQLLWLSGSARSRCGFSPVFGLLLPKKGHRVSLRPSLVMRIHPDLLQRQNSDASIDSTTPTREAPWRI